jgi:hypothetical protein
MSAAEYDAHHTRVELLLFTIENGRELNCFRWDRSVLSDAILLNCCDILKLLG